MTLPPFALNHLNLPARDPAALRQWYTDKLGFHARGPFLWSGGGLLVFVEGTPIAGEHLHFGFRADSMATLRAWIAALRARGVHVDEPHDDDAYSTTYVNDPEGNRFELFYEQPPTTARSPL
jgi:catechol 2,3-dioxygenase-like lactoylglutathione lyase family enzyme